MIAEGSSRLAHAASSRPITDSDGLNCMYVQAMPFVTLPTVDSRSRVYSLFTCGRSQKRNDISGDLQDGVQRKLVNFYCKFRGERWADPLDRDKRHSDFLIRHTGGY